MVAKYSHLPSDLQGRVLMSRMSLLGTAVVALLVGCGGADTPERQVRKVIERMETAAEARDVGDLTEHLSKNYRDAYRQGAAEASRHARGYFIANQAIHLLTKIESIDFPSSEEARATVLVGMVSREADASAAWDLAADLYRFELSLLREAGEWKVSYARWERS